MPIMIMIITFIGFDKDLYLCKAGSETWRYLLGGETPAHLQQVSLKILKKGDKDVKSRWRMRTKRSRWENPLRGCSLLSWQVSKSIINEGSVFISAQRCCLNYRVFQFQVFYVMFQTLTYLGEIKSHDHVLSFLLKSPVFIPKSWAKISKVEILKF